MIVKLNNIYLPKTLILGATGFIGTHFHKFYKNFHPDTIGFSRNNKKYYFDLEKHSFPTLSFLKKANPRFAIISAAISKIFQCENNKEITYKINVVGTLKLIELLVKCNITPIWFSSDYVFDGMREDYDENSITNPSTEYGKQKAFLEKEIPKITNGNFLILRIGKIYSTNIEDKTIFSEIFGSLKESKKYSAAIDQIFNLTHIDDLILATLKLQNLDARGLFNICGPDKLSRYQIAKKIAEKLSLNRSYLKPISLDDLDDLLIRPKNTSMINNKFTSLTNFKFKSFDKVLDTLTI